MIKVTFKEIQIITYPITPKYFGDRVDVSLVLCNYILCKSLDCNGESFGFKPTVINDNLMLCADMIHNIKSIEHVKPTDL